MIENTLSIVALVPGMAKENFKLGCVFLTKYIHFTQTQIFQIIFKNVNDFVFPSCILISLIFVI
jgi:hypothetical protein